MIAQALLHDLTTRGVILSANGDHLDIDAPDDALTNELLAKLAENKAALLKLLNEAHLCPGCAGKMRLQDRAQDAWYCPACRRWTDGHGQALPKIEAPKAITSDEVEARKLIEDLQAAGCVFVIEDGELRLRYPSRIPAGLWTRFESAGDVFRSMAMEATLCDGVDDEDSREWLM
jgi:ribosomal protein L37AE/L43A